MYETQARGEERLSTQSRGDITRIRIIEGAGITFSDLGYTASTFELIAKAAGVKLGSVYYHFKTKLLLAQAVITEQHDRSVQIISGKTVTGLTAAETLVNVSREMAELLISDPVVRAGLRLSLEDSSLSTPSLPFYDEWARLAAAIVKRGVDAGEFPTSIDPEKVASTLIGCFTGVQLLSNARSHRKDLFEHLDAFWRLLLMGLTPHVSPEAALSRLRGGDTTLTT